MASDNYKYIVIEVQTMDNGTVATLTYSYDTRNEALAKYHAILAVAAVTSLPKHGAIILRNDCVCLFGSAYGGAVEEGIENG